MIREKIKNKEDITEFVPENVEKYIKKNKLYEGLAYGKWYYRLDKRIC